MAVNKLPESVRSFLRTGIVITSPAQTVVELVLNCIDAGATSISVCVDLQNFRLEVSDNGCGINMEDIDQIGTRYMTSKCHSLQDLQTCLTHFGFRGEALASLREVTGFLTIQSHPSSSDDTFFKTFIRGKPYRAAVSTMKRQSPGTTVTAVEFMYNLPVRRKRIQEAVDLEEIKYQLECIALVHPQISVSLRNDVNSKTIMQSYKCSSVVQAFSHLFGEKIAGHLVRVSYKLNGYKLTGHIGKFSHTQKHLQLIYINKRLVLKTKLHKLVNALLAKSYILRPNGPWKNSPISKNLKCAFWLTFPPREKRNKFAVFVLNIECAPAYYDVSFEPRKTLVEFVDWDIVLKLVDEGVSKCLAQECIGVVDDSPSTSACKNCSQLSIIQEMNELEKECALASADMQYFSRNSNKPSNFVDVNGRIKSSMTLQGVHGLPARRRKSTSEQASTECATEPENPQDITNPPKNFCARDVTSTVSLEWCSENPFPSTPNFSSATAKHPENNYTYVNSSVEFVELFLPPSPKKARKSISCKVLSTESTDSENPLSTSLQQRDIDGCHASSQKRKSVDVHKILNMTKGKLKKFSFNSRNVHNVRHVSGNFIQQHRLSTLSYVKKNITALTNFSFSSPNDRYRCVSTEQNEDFSTEVTDSMQTNLSGGYQTSAEFGYTAALSREVSCASTCKPPVLSKSTQTVNGFNEVESNATNDNLCSALHTHDLRINVPCKASSGAVNYFLEPKLVSGSVTNTRSKLLSQKSKIMSSETPAIYIESGKNDMVMNDTTAGKTISLKYKDLPKSCLKSNILQEQAFCSKFIGTSKSVSFHANPKCNINTNVKFQSQDKRIQCTKVGQQDKCWLPSPTNNKFYMTSSDFLHSFKALQKKSVSFLDSNNYRFNGSCENSSYFVGENSLCYDIGNISNLNKADSKSFDNNVNYSNLEKQYKQHSNSCFDTSGSPSDTVLHLHDNIRDKYSDIKQNKESVEQKKQIQFSCGCCRLSSSVVTQTSQTPVSVVAVPCISTDDESSLVSSALINFSTGADSHPTTFPSEKCHLDADVVCGNSSCTSSCSLACRSQVGDTHTFSRTVSSAKSCVEVVSLSFDSGCMVNCKINETAVCPGNKGTTASLGLPLCDVRFGHLGSCTSSTENTIPCEQMCVSPAQALDEDSGLEPSSYDVHEQCTGIKICSSDCFCGRESVSACCSSSHNKHSATTGFPSSRDGDSCIEKMLGENALSVENQTSELIPSNVEMLFAPSEDFKKCSCKSEAQNFCNRYSRISTFENDGNVIVEDEGCNTTDEILHKIPSGCEGSQSVITSKPSEDKLQVSVGNGCVNDSGDVPKESSDGRESGSETQISQTCYSLYDICDSCGDVQNRDPCRGHGAGEVCKTTHSGSQATCVPSSQLLIEAADLAVHNMNASIANCDSGQSACASEEVSEELVEAVDTSAGKFCVHTSGAMSYEAPVTMQENLTYKMTERYDFMPKGTSPILQVPTGKSSETSSLTPESHKMLTTAADSSCGQLQDELATVKWGALAAEKSGTNCTELVDELMCSADTRMAYCEKDVPNITVTEKCAIKVYSVVFPHLLTKEAIAAARVLRQVDKKLILAVTTMDKVKPPHLLVLFDQHAVHERIRVEKLFRDYQMEGSFTHFKFTDAEPNVMIDLSAQEVRILSSFENEFHQMGLFYSVVNDTQIQVTKIPTCLHEREKRECKRGTSVLKRFLESLIREQVDSLIQTRGVACSVPSTLREIINSEACKGALKFGHELSTEECQMLVKHLALCNMPFHCAHGRPSVVPIADLSLVSQQEKFEKPRLWNLKENLKGIVTI